MAKAPINVKFRRVRRTFELPPSPAAPARPEGARALRPEKAARLAERELRRRAVEGEVMQISLDDGNEWIDLPPPDTITTVDETLAAPGDVWGDFDGTGKARPKKAPK